MVFESIIVCVILKGVNAKLILMVFVARENGHFGKFEVFPIKGVVFRYVYGVLRVQRGIIWRSPKYVR